MKPIGFSAYETIGMSIPNPRVCFRRPIPEDITPEELQELDEAIERADAQDAVERLERWLFEPIDLYPDGRIGPKCLIMMNWELKGSGYEVDPNCRPGESGGSVSLIKIARANNEFKYY